MPVPNWGLTLVSGFEPMSDSIDRVTRVFDLDTGFVSTVTQLVRHRARSFSAFVMLDLLYQAMELIGVIGVHPFLRRPRIRVLLLSHD